MIHSCLTIVIKAMCDLMSDNHSYSTKVKGLVLLFTEERRLQDSCWKHLTDKNNRRENTISKQKKQLPVDLLILVTLSPIWFLLGE